MDVRYLDINKFGDNIITNIIIELLDKHLSKNREYKLTTNEYYGFIKNYKNPNTLIEEPRLSIMSNRTLSEYLDVFYSEFVFDKIKERILMNIRYVEHIDDKPQLKIYQEILYCINDAIEDFETNYPEFIISEELGLL